MGVNKGKYNKMTCDELIKELHRCKVSETDKIKYIKKLISLYDVNTNDTQQTKSHNNKPNNDDSLLDFIMNSDNEHDILDQLIDDEPVNTIPQMPIGFRPDASNTQTNILNEPVNFNDKMNERLFNNIELLKTRNIAKPYAENINKLQPKRINTLESTQNLGRRQRII